MNTKPMNKEQFLAEIQGRLVLTDFSAPWCGPCRAMEPIIHEVAQAFGPQMAVMKIDIDVQKNLAFEFMVQSIPTLILFDDGKEMTRMVGLQTKAAMQQRLTSVVKI